MGFAIIDLTPFPQPAPLPYVATTPLSRKTPLSGRHSAMSAENIASSQSAGMPARWDGATRPRITRIRKRPAWLSRKHSRTIGPRLKSSGIQLEQARSEIVTKGPKNEQSSCEAQEVRAQWSRSKGRT